MEQAMKPIDYARKRKRLCEDAPSCPKCAEDQQIQLKEWINNVKWKCRTCKHQWDET